MDGDVNVDADQAVAADVIVIGGGQAGLAAGYYLRRAKLDFVILDDQDAPGGAWRHTWPSLRLFSPAEYSSLPGRLMPRTGDGNPDAEHVISYLRDYEQRYDLPIRRPVRVTRVEPDSDGYRVQTEDGRSWQTPVVISATGTWSRPFVPHYPGIGAFAGRQVHSANYAGPADFAGQRVLVVGGANSGAQIAADLLLPGGGDDAESAAEGASAGANQDGEDDAAACSVAAHVTWCTLTSPRYLPDDVDGRELFRLATARVQGEEDAVSIGQLGDIVVVPPVRAARDAGLLRASPMFDRLTADGAVWPDGEHREFDAIIWCTGFRPELRHLPDLPRTGGGLLDVEHTAVRDRPGLFVLGYGDWCGPASATLIGVGQWARATVGAAERHLATR